MHGPLDVLRESWTALSPGQTTVVSHLLDIRSRLAEYCDLVHTNMQMAQQQPKQWYDRTARQRKFNGDNVLVLLPTSANKLLAQWEGPYPITRCLYPVNYEVNLFDKRKNYRVLHVNMLRQWFTRQATASYTDEAMTTDEEEDIQLFDEGASTQPVICNELTQEQRAAIQYAT